MHDNGRDCVVQGYNAQLAVDSQTQVIVAVEVTQDVLDRGQLLPMIEDIEKNAGKRPEVITADAGYWETQAVQNAIQSGAQVLVPPDGHAALKTGQPRQMTDTLWRGGCAPNWPPKSAAGCIECGKPLSNP
jgi:DDE family transposase